MLLPLIRNENIGYYKIHKISKMVLYIEISTGHGNLIH